MAFRQLPKLMKKSVRLVREEGVGSFLKMARKYLKHHYSVENILSYHKLKSFQLKKHALWYSASGRPVAIVIPSYNDHKILKVCLESLQRTLPKGKARIIIADDASPDPAHRKFLESLSYPNVKVVFRPENGGFSKAVNTGLAEAMKLGHDVVLLNSDIEGREGWLQGLQFAAYQDPTLGIVGPKLLYPDGTIQSAGSHRNNVAPEWFDHYYRFKPAHYGPANVPAYAIAMTGAALYFKKEVLERVGLFDEGYGMGFEDVDYCLRAWQAGFRVGYTPFSELVHHESVTRGKTVGAREASSKEYFWKTWGDFFDRRNVRDESGRIRVIYVLEATNVAGGHRIVFEHLNRLQATGKYSCELYALEGAPDWFPLNVPVRSFPSYDSLAAELAKHEAIKVATWWKTGEPVWLASVLKGIAVNFVQDIESSYYNDQPRMQQAALASYRREFRYLTTSGWNQDQLKEMHHDATIVPCGIDTGVFKTIPGVKREENALLTAGRENYLKNFALTLEGWSQLSGAEQPMLWMYGVEPNLAKGLKNARYIVKPTDDGINQLLNQATAFILTSRHEGFALTILEAMAAGAVVLTTDADGNRDFCVDGQNCLMIEQENARSVASAIRRAFSDKRLQEKLRQGGYETASRFQWSNVTPQLDAYFSGLVADISGKGAPAAQQESTSRARNEVAHS